MAEARAPKPADIAIVGMSAIMPGAADVRRFWQLILEKTCAITEVPTDRWPVERYFNADRSAPDTIASKWGGFLPDVAFDPTRWGIPPASVGAIDPAQLLALVAAEAAFVDAGMAEMPADLRARAAVILGFTGGLGELGLQYAARAELLRAAPDAAAATHAFLPEWTSDSFAGLLPNVVAGRIANRFDLGGANFVVDAACGTSLAALRQGVMELETGRADLVLCGAVEAAQGPFAFACFSNAQALSPRGRCRAFDADADGTAIAEGVAMLVLRRLADAQAAGDRIYAVIKGIDGSSDGRAKGLMAPVPEGQKRALRRAYAQAGYSPATVALFEAHGTGTVAGDAAEIESLSSVLAEHGAAPRAHALGSVKTLIGHAEGAAGMAGLIKAALALHHRVLPPHAGVTTPNAALREPTCPLALHDIVRPWLPADAAPRRAGVSAFGFGGANFHVTLEEACGQASEPSALWPTELLVWRAADRVALAAQAEGSLAALRVDAQLSHVGLSRALWHQLGSGPATMAIVAATHAQLEALLGRAIARLRAADNASPLPAGLHICDAPLVARGLGEDGKLALLFAGQSSQYPDMAAELAITFPEVATVLADADAILAATPTYAGQKLSRLIFPAARFGDDENAAACGALAATDVAQPALGAVEVAMLEITKKLGMAPDMVAGHSYGEYVALHASGVLSRTDTLRISEARGRAIVDAARDGDLGTMAAVAADASAVRAALGDGDVAIANLNAPRQTVISGPRAAIVAAIDKLAERGLAATPIAVAAAFHSPLMAPAQAPLARFLDTVEWARPRIPVYANTTGAPHDTDPRKIRALMGRHLLEPVDFIGMIEGMYAAGARVFLEIGPKTVLSGLTRRILAGRPHAAVALDGAGGGFAGLLNALGALLVQGVTLDLAPLFDCAPPANDARNEHDKARPADHRTAWVLNGMRVRRADAPLVTAVAPQISPIPRQPPRAPGTIEPPMTRRAARRVDMHGTSPARLDEEPASGLDRTMAEHHETMRQFLQTQERLMLAYLGGAHGAPSTSAGRPVRPFSTPRPTQATRQAAPSPKPATQPAALSPAHAPAQQPAPSPAAVAPPASVTADAPSAPSDLATQLLDIASDRTGYPADMLGLDMDMEADLGIDSIKRVEILGAFRMAQPDAVSAALQPQMEQIAKAKTLQQVLDKLAAALSAPASQDTARPFDQPGPVLRAAPTRMDQSRTCIARYVMRPEPEPLPSGTSTRVASGLYLVVPDALGVADALVPLLKRDGASVRLVPTGLDDDNAVTAWLETVRATDRIRGVVGLAGVTPPDAAPRDATDWRAGMDALKALFPLLRFAAPDLADGGTVTLASAMGGLFARDALERPETARAFPGAGGIVGLAKTLAMEWPGCHCKAVDLDPALAPARLAAILHVEIAARFGRREVGYPRGARTIFRTTLAPLDVEAALAARPDEDWVMLAIGGARGITSETLRPFAAAGATCVIAGRAALPGPEDVATSSLADAAALRRHFLANAAAAGTRPLPAKIEANVQSVIRDREARANVADLIAMGATLDERICDVREEAQVEVLLGALYARYGRIDAVLVGAGLIEDKLVVDKTRESAARVIDTKVDGAIHVTRHLRPDSLQLLALFSSVAGRYGNRGQADYAAANEVLNRLAWQLQARWGAGVKVVSVNWGAWARTTNGAGMLTPDTARQFRERGLKLIEPEEGRDVLLHELLYGPRDEVEVVAGEHAWDAYEDAAGRPAIAGDARNVA